MTHLIYRTIFVSLLLACFAFPSFALVMKGVVKDKISKKPMAQVNIVNIYTNRGMTTDSTGAFSIEVEKGQLVEFRKMSYKVVNIRVNANTIPPFYEILMQEAPIELKGVDVVAQRRQLEWKEDSVRTREVYRQALEHYKLEGIDLIQHPFDALSKRNRQIWEFQKKYDYWEQQKFVDYTFNERLVVQLTKLGSDSLPDYINRFRPHYDQLKAWTLYEYYAYIKQTVAVYRGQAVRRRQEFKQPEYIDYEE